MKHFKIFFAILTAVLLASVLTVGTAALEGVETIDSHAWSILVDEKPLDTSVLPLSAYEVGEEDITDVMVPLRLIFEALGYTVGWNDATREITVVDGKRLLTLTNGCMTASFTGLVDSQYTCEMPLFFPVIIHNGHTFIPMSLVACFDVETKIDAPNVWIRTMREKMEEADKPAEPENVPAETESLLTEPTA